MNAKSQLAQHAEILSRLVIRACCYSLDATTAKDLHELRCDLVYVDTLDESQRDDFRSLASAHHVIVRALTALQNVANLENKTRVAEWCDVSLAAERVRADLAVETLHTISRILESRGCPVVVIKSLDHWPDFGSDMDLYTSADEPSVTHLMEEEFHAHSIQRSWGDRLANKWNYSVPGLPELIEIHVQYLGQTGEHEEMARRLLARRVPKSVGRLLFHVPAPEERIIISALQRMYRHFYFRLCDMVDIASLMQTETIDFEELKKATSSAGIWPGVATFLCLIEAYLESYGGALPLPDDVVASAHSRESTVQFKEGYLRVSKKTATALYASELLQATLRRDVRALARLPLLPPLGVCALLARGISGSDKGIW